jgi:hypothetical protein
MVPQSNKLSQPFLPNPSDSYVSYSRSKTTTPSFMDLTTLIGLVAAFWWDWDAFGAS